MARTDRVYLKANEPRCEPYGHCPKAEHCARAQALIGRSELMRCHPSGGGCIRFLSVADARKALFGGLKAEAKPAVEGL